MVNWHKADLLQRMYVNVDGNKKISMPRYFKDKIYTDIEREDISCHFQLLHFDAMESQIKKYKELWGEDYGPFLRESIKAQFERMYSRHSKNSKL